MSSLTKRFAPLAFLLLSVTTTACAVEADEEEEGQAVSSLDADDEGENEDFDDDAGGALSAEDDGDPSILPLKPLPRLTAFFTYPNNGPDKRPESIENQLVAMAQHAQPGSQIRVAMFHWTRVRVAEAFVYAAKKRQADVRIVLGEGGNPAVKRLKDALGDRVTICKRGKGSCIGTNINHDKFFLFSSLDNGATNVVAQASQNMTNPQRALHNNMVVAQDASLYSGYLKYWKDLQAQKADATYDGTAEGTSVKAFMFPRTDDTVGDILDNVKCDGGGALYVNMALFVNRKTVARKLAQRAKDGCKVRVVVRPKNAGTGTSVMSILRDAGKNLEVSVIPKGPGGNHSKYLLVDAKFRGTRQKLVFTGSHNYTRKAWKENDEVLIRVDDPSTYGLFLFDWFVVRSKAS